MIKSNFNEPAQETYEERLAKLEAKADKIEEMLGHPKNPQPTLQPKGTLRVQTNEMVRERLSHQRTDIQDEIEAIKKERAQRHDAETVAKKKSI